MQLETEFISSFATGDERRHMLNIIGGQRHVPTLVNRDTA
jgi:hypothetical protein